MKIEALLTDDKEAFGAAVMFFRNHRTEIHGDRKLGEKYYATITFASPIDKEHISDIISRDGITPVYEAEIDISHETS